MKFIKTPLTLLLFILFPLSSWAIVNHCYELDVTLINKTGHRCVLQNQKLVHGQLSHHSQFSATLAINQESSPVIIKQTAFGPKLRLKYQCGNKYISIESDQSLCFLKAGHVSTHILEAYNMGAQPISQEGSFLWQRHGSIQWTLH